MAEEPTDWKVWVILDRVALAKDIANMARILARQRVFIIVSASSGEEAEEKARLHFLAHAEVLASYITELNPRRMPTGVP